MMRKTTLSGLLGLVTLGTALCGALVYLWGFPTIGKIILETYPEFSFCYYPWLIFLWITGVPCYVALFFIWKISQSIRRDQAFSYKNARRFRWISLLSLGDAAFFVAGNILFLFLNMNHPSVALCSLGIAFVGCAIAVACEALSHLAKKAAYLQEESDFTI